MSKHRTLRAAYVNGLVVGLCMLSLCNWVYSQANSGTITGTVFDPQQAVIPGAAVTITLVEQGLVRNVVTNSSGLYEAKFLPIGSYSVSIEHSGFKKQVKTDLILTVGQTLRADFKLEVGVESQTVEVKADVTQDLKTESSEVSQVITSSQVVDLPLNGRSFEDLIPLNAGVTNGLQGAANSGYNFNGQRTDQNMFMVEGIDNMNWDNNLQLKPSIDAIEEFQIQTGNFSAEFGRAAGGIVLVQLRSGTNAYHGTVFEFLRNDKLDANGFFENQVPPPPGESTAPKTPLKRNQFGGTFGGPLKKDNTFFFVDYQGSRQRLGRSEILTVPTLDERRGDFSKSLPAGTPIFQNALLGTLYPECDPANFVTCQQVPQSAFDPAALRVAELYPAPNVPGVFVEDLGTFNNFATSGSSADDADSFDVKFDFHPRSSDSISFHYSFSKTNSVIPAAFGDGTVGPCIDCGLVLGLLAGNSRGRSQNVGLTEIHNFSSTTVNEFRAGLNRVSANYDGAHGEANLADEVGISNVNVDKFTTGLPWFFFSPNPGWIGTSPFLPFVEGWTTYQFTDNLSHVRGKHRIKTGFDLRRRHDNQIGNFFGKGFYVFVPFFTGNAYADFLTGRALQIQQDYTEGTRGLRGIDYGFYIQDDFKVTPRLTLNMGIRYELYPGYYEVADRYSDVDPLTGTARLAGKDGNPRQFVNTDKNNWAPRFGFAYSPWADGKTVIRGGYGISYVNAGKSVQSLKLNPPYTNAFTFFNLGETLDAVYRISDGLPTELRPTVENFDPTNPTGSWNRNDPDQRTPYSQYFNFGIERALPGDMILDVAYVGARGVKLPGQVEGNPTPPGPTGNVAERRVLNATIPNVDSLGLFVNGFASTYHSLQAKLQKRFSYGLQFLTTYTWSRSIDNLNGSPTTGGGHNNDSANPQNPFDWSADRGRSGFDRTHRFVTAFNYDLPFGKGRHFGSKWNSVTNAILGGWQFNGILTFSGGNPFSVFASSADSCGCTVGELRADRIKDGNLPEDQRSTTGWFDKTAFTDPPSSTATEGGGRYGNSGRNIIEGPGLANVDLSVFKEFQVHENVQLQFRGEFFNAFNRVNFLYPDSSNNAIWQTGGLITKALPPRIGQIALKIIF